MYRIKLFATVIAFALIFGTGCDDLFDTDPSTSVPGEHVVSDAEGVRAMRANMYHRMIRSSTHTTSYMIQPDALAGNTANRDGSTRLSSSVDTRAGDGATTHMSPYSAGYYITSRRANNIIGLVEPEEVDGLSEAEGARYQAEAYAMRAFTWHNIARTYAYDPGTQGAQDWPLGIVLHTEPTTDAEEAEASAAPRASIEETYDQILDDLANAKAIFEEYGDAGNNAFISEEFVEGMKARVQLYNRNWSEAAQHAEEALAIFGDGLVDTEDEVMNMFSEMQLVSTDEGEYLDNVQEGDHPEAFWKLDPHPQDEQIAGSNSNDGLSVYTTERWLAQLPTDEVIDNYEDDDYRLNWYAECYSIHDSSFLDGCTEANENGYALHKYTGANGNQSDNIPYMRAAEMYLILAEAEAKATNDPGSGLPYLNDLREARGLDALDANDFDNMEEFEDEILDERNRELIYEGHRFYDLKRLERDIPMNDGTTKFSWDSHRILSNIGTSTLGSNPELCQNPGYELFDENPDHCP